MKILFPLLLWFVTIILPYQTWAASSQELELAELVRIADRIDLVRCVDMTGYWQGKEIVTDNKLMVLTSVKGAASAQPFVVTTIGGTALHPRLKVPVKMEVPGGASFTLNSEVLVFTKRMPSGQYQLVGFSQGMFTTAIDAGTGKRVVPVGYKLLTTQDGQTQDIFYSPNALFDAPGTKIGVRNIELDELISRIEKLL